MEAQRRKPGAESLFIPPSVERQRIAGDDICAPLIFGEMIQNDHRHFCERKLACSEKTTVARDDAGVGVPQDGIVEAELRYAGGDLRNLGVRWLPTRGYQTPDGKVAIALMETERNRTRLIRECHVIFEAEPESLSRLNS